MAYAPDSYDLTDEQRALRDDAHQFARDVLRPAGMELDALSPDDVIASGSPLWEVFRTAYERGYHLRGFPEALGGANLDRRAQQLVAEELGWGCAGLAISLGVASMPFRAAAMTGQPDLMREVVMPFVKDREGRFIGCWAGTEPNHGSDGILYSGPYARADIHLDCVARREGDEWVINGQKSAWVSNGSIATHALLSACVDPSRGMAGNVQMVVPLNVPGVTRGKPTNKIGQRGLNQGEIFFDDARVPAYCAIAEPQPPGAGDAGGGGILAGANAGMSTTFTGVARAAFEEALAYSQSRIQGGVPLCDHQLVQRRLFDMFMKVEAARALSRKANDRLLSGLPTLHFSIAAKVFCTQTALEVASDAIQIHGGMGLVKGVLVEQLYRDARSSLIEDGANDTLALAGARELFDRPVGLMAPAAN